MKSHLLTVLAFVASGSTVHSIFCNFLMYINASYFSLSIEFGFFSLCFLLGKQKASQTILTLTNKSTLGK